MKISIMAMRRPRIKPVANIQLNCKRKTKSVNDLKAIEVGESSVKEIQKDVQLNTAPAKENSNAIKNILEVRVDDLVDTSSTGNNLCNTIDNVEKRDNLTQNPEEVLDGWSIEKDIGNVKTNTIEKENVETNTKEQSSQSPSEVAVEIFNDSDAFKCPPNVGYQKSVSNASNSGIDDVFYSDIEENAIQMDLEKSPVHSSMSPSKNLIRQRIRPTPHFGQRRNSFVCSSPSPYTSGNEENHLTNNNTVNDSIQTTQTRRERHHSASFIGNNHTSTHVYHHQAHKYLPHASMGRIRTESGCSVFSDTNVSTYKSRKTDDQKQNTRKDFEARFHNGVPEKSSIKMSDLIYYNPATNPMEQKSNPNVKLEDAETLTNDVKPFIENEEKDTYSSIDSETLPVPQLKLNAKGELILDDKSLVIETTAEQEARKVLANSSLIYLDENTGMNGFYSRQKRTREWIPSETIKFYRCLQNIGTDFSLMVSLFPNRTRRDLKLKFKKEERKNSHLINKALLYPKQFDIESLKEQINEEEKLRGEQTKNNKEKFKESRKRKVSNTSIAKRVLVNEDVYQNEKTVIDRNTKTNKQKSDDIEQNEKEYEIENEHMQKRSSKIDVSYAKSADHDQIEKEIVDTKNGSLQVKSGDVGCNKNKQKIKTTKIKKPDKLNKDKIIENNFDSDVQNNESGSVVKRRRRRKHTPNKFQKEEIIIIKEEIIKVENKHEWNQTYVEPDFHDSKQLQTEINELLDSDLEIQYNTTCESATASLFPLPSQIEQLNQLINEPSCASVNLEMDLGDSISAAKDDFSLSHTRSQSPSNTTHSQSGIGNEISSLQSKIPDSQNVNSDTCSSLMSEHNLHEDDIQTILTELAEGTLVLVSTLNPDDPDKVLNEIYMVNKGTGDLCEEPLNIPDNIVQCILNVVG